MNKRNLTGFWRGYSIAITIIMVIFILYTSMGNAFHPALQGSLMVAMGLMLAFVNFPVSKSTYQEKHSRKPKLMVYGTKSTPSVLDIFFVISGAVPCFLISIYWEEYVIIPMNYETYHLFLGAALLVALLEATRRTIGMIVPILVFAFIAYMLLGHWIPGYWGHAYSPVSELFYTFYMTTEGVWGVLTDMVSRLIAIFIILGPVLFATGLGNYFVKSARLIAGRMRGGAAQIAVISSAALGMITGATVANVATTGTFTIPTMKRFGYKPEIAGATEAAASCSGQILPPIMGAGAFIMAELINVPYAAICKAATIPAICFVFGIGSGVYCLAGRHGLGKLPAHLVPKLKELLNPAELLGTIVPIGLLLYLLMAYVAPETCAAWALYSAIAIFLIFGSWKLSDVRGRIKNILKAFYTATNGSLVMLIVMMSCVQVVVTIINATGFGVIMAQFIMDLTQGVTLYVLIGVMIITLILGMGMATTAAYVIAAAAMMPIMKQLGMPELPTHLFIFYFSIAAAITPPVCVAVFTAQAIAGGNWLRIAVYAMGLSLGGYIVPYFFIFQPAFLMEGSFMTIVRVTIGCMVAMFFIEAATFGYLKRMATWLERTLFFIGGMLLLDSGLMTDIVGVLMILTGMASHLFLPDLKMPLIGRREAEPVLVDMEKLDGMQQDEKIKKLLDEGGKEMVETEEIDM